MIVNTCEPIPENFKPWYCVFTTHWRADYCKGEVNSAIMECRYAEKKPEDFTYEPNATRICFGKWYGNIDEANAAVAAALA